MILKRYTELDYDGQILQTHYRTSGSGAPLLLLHPSPLSSAFMEPLIDLFTDIVTVYAPDTPGYGASDPLPEPSEDLSGYVDWLRRYMQEIGIDKAGIYGSATGAQIAIQFARSFPEMTDYLVLDNAVHFTDAEREEIVDTYFPDLSPQADGSHLQLAWEISSKLYQYFPWFDESDECKVADAPPPTWLIQATAMAYLQAGDDYDRAYRAAFYAEDARNVQPITCPVRFIRWEGSMLRRHAEKLDDFEWPDNIRMVHCDAPPEARYATLRDVISKLKDC